MKLKDYNPYATLFYLLSVIALTMFTVNPAVLMLSLAGAALVCDKKRIKSDILFHGALFLIITLTNPLFNHNGVTPLFFINNNPVTLEALLYGVDIAMMVTAVTLWFRVLNTVLTQDKLLYIMGGISPKLAIMLSNALRFIPRLVKQSKIIKASCSTLGLFNSDSVTDRLKGTLRIYSALITWSLESAIETGASMKARGFGLKPRTHYSLFRFTPSDIALITVTAALDTAFILLLLSGALAFEFYPRIAFSPLTPLSLAVIAATVFIPALLDIKENILWKYYKSKI